MDVMTLKSLQLNGNHGFYESERKEGNRFELDIILKGNFRQAGETDDLKHTVNYESVEEVVLRIMNGPPQKLIESLCREMGDALFNQFTEVSVLELAFRKLNPPIQTPAAYAEIRMQWQR
ncbi:MAG: dihydroneopterin aldolase [Balneolaceae bacterium]